MRSEQNRGHHGERRRHEKGGGRRGHGAKTFRRSRALSFLERLELKRDTLKRQLETPELQSLNPVIAGELKAVDAMLQEFIQVFELYEADEEETEEANKKEEQQ